MNAIKCGIVKLSITFVDIPGFAFFSFCFVFVVVVVFFVVVFFCMIRSLIDQM